MNKKRRGESVLRAGGLEHEEASARAVNAEPWEPMPGMVKRECPKCRYFFTSSPHLRPPRSRAAGLRRARPAIHGPRLTPQREAEGLPPRDGAGAFPCLRVVGDARKQPPQLDRSRELAALAEDGAYRCSLCLADNEHRWSMVTCGVGGNCRDGVRIQSLDRPQPR
jgi:hypothetical protein